MLKKQIIKFLLFTLCVVYVQIGFAQKITVINQKGTKFDVVNNIVTTSTTSPTNPQIGDVWFDTTTNLSKIYNGSNWDELGGINTNFDVVGTNLEITDSKGTLSIPLEDISTDDQNIDYVAFDPATNILTVAIENGDPKTVNLTALYADGSETKITGAGINVVSGLGTTANPYIITGTEVDGSITNEVNTAFGSSVNTLTITDSNSALTAPIVNSNVLSIASGEITSTVNGVASTPIALPVADGTETVVTAGTDITVTGDGSTSNPYAIINSAPDQTVSITGAGASIVTGSYPNFTVTSTDNVDDADADPNNEKSDLSLVGGILTLSNPTTASNQVDLSTVNTDTQDLSIDSSGTVISLVDGGSVTVNTDDADADPNNEKSDLSLVGGILTLSNPTTASNQVDLSTVNTDTQDLSIDSSGTIISLVDGGSVTVNTNDADADPTNENQTVSAGTGITVSQSGQDFAITNSAPDQTVVLNGAGATTISGTYPNFTITSTDNVDDADADPNNEKSDLSLSGNILTLSNPTTVTNQVDLSTVNTDSQNLSSVVGTANETVEIQISNGTNTTINIQDADADPNNELQTLTQSTGASATGDVTLSDGGGTVKLVSANADNQIIAGTDGGAYLNMPIIYAAGRHESDELNNSTPKTVYNATITRTSQGVFRVDFITDIGTTNYIVQLAVEDCGGNCADNGNSRYDDPDVAYYNIESSGFNIRAGDNDNGTTIRDLADLGFMFTVIKLP